MCRANVVVRISLALSGVIFLRRSRNVIADLGDLLAVFVAESALTRVVVFAADQINSSQEEVAQVAQGAETPARLEGFLPGLLRPGLREAPAGTTTYRRWSHLSPPRRKGAVTPRRDVVVDDLGKMKQAVVSLWAAPTAARQFTILVVSTILAHHYGMSAITTCRDAGGVQWRAGMSFADVRLLVDIEGANALISHP